MKRAFINWLEWSWAGGWLHAIWHLDTWFRFSSSAGCCWMGRLIWTQLNEDMPGLQDELAEAMADHEAGRYYTLDHDTGEFTPNPDWPEEGPQPTHE